MLYDNARWEKSSTTYQRFSFQGNPYTSQKRANKSWSSAFNIKQHTSHFSPRLIFHGYHVSWNQNFPISVWATAYLPSPTLTTNNGQQVGQGKGRFAVPRHWHWSKFNKELNKFYWDYMYMVITPRGILRRDENFHGDLSCKAAFSPQIVT